MKVFRSLLTAALAASVIAGCANAQDMPAENAPAPEAPTPGGIRLAIQNEKSR